MPLHPQARGAYFRGSHPIRNCGTLDIVAYHFQPTLFLKAIIALHRFIQQAPRSRILRLTFWRCASATVIPPSQALRL